MSVIKNRHDFVMLFDVTNGNPNGDPDAGNMPRVDPETRHGIVSDACLKRKIRNFVELVKAEAPGYGMYVKTKAILNQQHERAYEALDLSKEDGDSDDAQMQARRWMCRNFYDVRAFGAVMSTGSAKCGQVRGPVQVTFARSVDPVMPLEISITRVAVTSEREAEAQKGRNRTMGDKFVIPYGLYRAHGFVSAPLADGTEFSEEDLELLWTAVENMFEHDRSAARGEMSMRKLIVFRHDDKLGNAPAHRLFERVRIDLADDSGEPARKYGDYTVTINRDGLPKGVQLIERL